jgi:tetratricopeptide (TPR) repeat protein
MKRKKKSTKKAKQPIHPIVRLIQDGIAEFGLKSMVVAELFLRLARAIVVRPSRKDLNIPTGIERLTDGGRTTFSAVFLDMYLFGDSSLTEERIGHIETAFAFAIPTWSKTDPQAADHAVLVLNSLARHFSDSGAYGKWEAMSKRVLDMCRNHLGQNSETLALMLGDVGSLYSALRMVDEANDCLKEALTISESDPTRRTAMAPKLLSTLAWVAMQERKLVLARMFIDQAIEILEQAPTRDKFVLLGTLVESAHLLQEIGDVEGFAQVSLRAEQVAADVWESDPKGARDFIVVLIRSHKVLGRQEGAERLIRWLAGKIKELARETGIDLLDRLIEEMRPRYGNYGLPANLEEILAQIKTERDCPTGQ